MLLKRSPRATAGVGNQEATDTSRRVHNLIRYAVVKETDYEKAVVRVSLQDGELLSDWVPWWTLRAGPDRFWWAPEEDEVVLLFSPSGELGTGLVFPAGFSNQNQPADRETVQRAVFEDGTVVEYDRDLRRYLIDCGEDAETAVAVRAGKVIIHGATTVNIDGGESVIINGGTIYLNSEPSLPFPEAEDVLTPEAEEAE
ncbi:MAG: phage baseplate assembly protein V [Cyanobacteria bacterium J06638_7]